MTKLIVPQIGRRLEELTTPWALVLIGLPGSGKSTFIPRIISYLDKKPVVLSTDNVIEEYAVKLGKTYSEVFNTVSFSVFKTEMKKVADAALAARTSVIIDQTNMASKARRTKLEPFVKAGYTCISLGFDVSDKVLRERLDKRAEATGKVIPPYVIKQMLSSYTSPTKAEGFHLHWDYE